METNGKSMLRVQIGPVQDFIAAARTSRDLWSGSYLLSRLMAAALDFLEQQEETEIIFPCTEELGICRWWSKRHQDGTWIDGAETPCLSNKLVACVPTNQAEQLAQAVKSAVQCVWHDIADEVWQMLPASLQQDEERKSRYGMQVRQHLSVDYAHLPMEMTLQQMQEIAQGVTEETPLTKALARLARGEETAQYAAVYYLVDHCMNAVRKVNSFAAWNEGVGRDAGWYAGRHLSKDFLTGKEEQVFCLKKDKEACQDWKYTPYLSPCENDVLGAITLIKRLWYVNKLRKFESRLPQLNARYGPNVEDLSDKNNHYYVVLAMDGDNIGAALTRQNESGGKIVDLKFHRQFSTKLAEFAQHKAGEIVQAHEGTLIYAGGDDVLALLPMHVRKADGSIATAVDCAAEIGIAFREAMQDIRQGMTVSAGLALVHSKGSLQDAVNAARHAEGRAKSTLGRNAFSISALKRSGEIVEWGAKWDSGARELINTWINDIENKHISAKGSHRYAELLTPYVSHQHDLVTYQQHKDYDTAAGEIAMLEFESMLERQWMSKNYHPSSLRDNLQRYVQHLTHNSTPVGQENNPADALVPMCSVIAFIGRNPNDK